ncbi:MAG: N-acyl homoserine lactonase family protein [Spirochaetes bacterium]|nr:MAG: N-acyl homoserine lactonase family protein [Spirochaetota bacterium]
MITRRKALLLGSLLTVVLVGIGTVSRCGTADVKVYAFKCGVLKTQTQYMLKDTRVGTPMDIPVTFFLVKHNSDWVAFDLGNNAMVAKDPIGYWSEPVVKAYTPVMKDYEEFKVQIKKELGIEPKDIKLVVLSHGHLDHAGAVDNFAGTKVPIYMQKKELENVKAELEKFKATGKKTAYIPGDWDKMSELNIKTIEGIFDVFGDQSVVVFPTPGHTPGHESMMVKAGGKSFIFCSDANYTLENMIEAIPPGLAWDLPQSLQGLYVFKVMKWLHPSVEIVPSHDPTYWKDKPVGAKEFKI